MAAAPAIYFYIRLFQTIVVITLAGFPSQEGIEPRAHTKQTALLEQLKTATKQHDQSELERKYAVRYHKVRSSAPQACRRAQPITYVDMPQQLPLISALCWAVC